MEDLKTLHWQTLKKMMEDAGLEFKSKEQAIEELAKLQQPAEDPPEPAAVEPVALVVEAGTPVFNRSRPFGEVYGDVQGAPGARFIQAGHYFNNVGEVVGKA